MKCFLFQCNPRAPSSKRAAWARTRTNAYRAPPGTLSNTRKDSTRLSVDDPYPFSSSFRRSSNSTSPKRLSSLSLGLARPTSPRHFPCARSPGQRSFSPGYSPTGYSPRSRKCSFNLSEFDDHHSVGFTFIVNSRVALNSIDYNSIQHEM